MIRLDFKILYECTIFNTYVVIDINLVIVGSEVVEAVWSGVELESGDVPGVPHERLVVADHLHGVLQLPAVAAQVLEARQVPESEQRSVGISISEE